MSKAKNKLILTDEGNGVWNYEVRQADAQMNLTALEMMKAFKMEIEHIIKIMENEKNDK